MCRSPSLWDIWYPLIEVPRAGVVGEMCLLWTELLCARNSSVEARPPVRSLMEGAFQGGGSCLGRVPGRASHDGMEVFLETRSEPTPHHT